MEEKWIEIDGTSGRYSVSSFGRVRANWCDVPQRNKKHRTRIEKQYFLKPAIHTTGYYRVSLGRGNSKYVHRLVAQAFLENQEKLPQVDHIDGNRLNNSLENLRWVSHRQNCLYGGDRHGWEPQRIASAKRRIHETRREEYQALVDAGYSFRQVAKIFGTSHSAVSSALKALP